MDVSGEMACMCDVNLENKGLVWITESPVEGNTQTQTHTHSVYNSTTISGTPGRASSIPIPTYLLQVAESFLRSKPFFS